MGASKANFSVEISRGALARFLMAAIGFIGSIIFARILGPSEYGQFYVVVSVVNVLINPIVGWGTACKKRISEAGFPVPEALGSALIGAVLLSAIIPPTIYLVQQFIPLYDLSGLFVPFALFFISISFFDVTTTILSARANFSASQWSDLLRSVLTTPLQLAFVLLGFGAGGMVYGVAIATIITTPYVVHRIGIRPSYPSRSTLESIGKYAKFSIPNSFLNTAKSRIDILLLGALLTSASVGDYQVAMQLSLPGTFIASVASIGLMARVSEHLSHREKDAARVDLNNSLKYASVLSIPLFFGAVAMPNDLLVTIFGNEYSGSGNLLVGLTLYSVLKTQKDQLGATINGIDRPDIGTKIGTLTLTLNIILGLILLHQYGTLGVVIATIISEVVAYCMNAYIVKKHLPALRIFSRPLGHQLVAGLVMFLVIDHVHTATGVSWWGDLVGLITIGGVAYFVLLICISSPFRGLVKTLYSDIIRGI